MTRRSSSSRPKQESNNRAANARAVVRTEYSAGGVVFRRTSRGVLFGFIKDGVGKWTFPKGRIGRGERIPAAALRESREEMGLRQLRLVAPLGTTSIWFKDRFERVGETVHKYITYFLMETAPNEQGKPQGRLHGEGEPISEIRWVPYRQAPKFLSYKNMGRIVQTAVRHLDAMQKR